MAVPWQVVYIALWLALATMLSVAMMFRHTFARSDLALRIETAVRAVLAAGLRTGDIALPGEATVGTRAMGDAVIAALPTWLLERLKPRPVLAPVLQVRLAQGGGAGGQFLLQTRHRALHGLNR